MDKNNLKMIDHKTFLSIMKGITVIIDSEKFNWA
jgi:hypothetical protein